ncbi:hypothetical protein TNCV_4653981 [Trichonephila clavipes]|nr:hypothetical protein TNCV_4653981 [Trichonephila clavipes]
MPLQHVRSRALGTGRDPRTKIPFETSFAPKWLPILHHDNARPHIARCVLDVLQQINVEIFPHLPYSIDLTPCVFCLFPQFKKPLRGKQPTGELASRTPDLNPVEHIEMLLGGQYGSYFQNHPDHENSLLEETTETA